MPYLELEYGDVSWGIAAASFGRIIVISQDTWAPGIWAGAEGIKIDINDKIYNVVRIDLNNRYIELDRVVTPLAWHTAIYPVTGELDESV